MTVNTFDPNKRNNPPEERDPVVKLLKEHKNFEIKKKTPNLEFVKRVDRAIIKKQQLNNPI